MDRLHRDIATMTGATLAFVLGSAWLLHPDKRFDPIAIAALLVALVTYRAVLRQLKIANEQVAIANEQLTLARAELKAVQDDLAYSKEQSAVLNRRAELRVYSPNMSLGGTLTPNTKPTITINVYNFGNKPSRDFKIIIGTPPGYTQWACGATFVPTRTYNVSNAELAGYTFSEKTFGLPVFPGDVSLKVDFWILSSVFIANLGYEAKPILWQVISEEGVTPPGEYRFAKMKTNPELTYEVVSLKGIG